MVLNLLENLVKNLYKYSPNSSRAVSQPKSKQSKTSIRASSTPKSMPNHKNGLKSVGRFTVSNVPQVMSNRNVAARALKSRGKRLSLKEIPQKDQVQN